MDTKTMVGRLERRREPRGGPVPRTATSRSFRRLVAVAVAMAAVLLATPAAAQAAEAPPIPVTILDNHAHGAYLDIYYQRPWVQWMGVSGAVVAAAPDAVTELACSWVEMDTKSSAAKSVCKTVLSTAFKVAGLGALRQAQQADGCLKVRYYMQAVYGGQSVSTDPAMCLRDVHGSIGVEWMAHGGSGGILGYATTDELSTPDHIGRFNHFRGGSIYWSPATGAHEVHGAIRDKWAQLGWETSVLGYPTTGELPTPVKRGSYSSFQRGMIYFSAATGAHEVHGSILEQYRAVGYENSRLGFPTTDEFALPGGGRQVYFQNGCRIEWRPGAPGLGTFVICN